MIGPLLKAARQKRGLSQREVASRTKGVLSAAGLSRIESGQRSPTYRTLLAISPVLNVTVSIRPEGLKLTRHRSPR